MSSAGGLFRECGVSCVILKTSDAVRDYNFNYFTGLDRFRNREGILILRKGVRPVVLASPLEYGNFPRGKFRLAKVEKREDLLEIMKGLPRKVGINYSSTTLSSMKGMKKLLPGRKFADVSKCMEKMREIKTAGEQKRIRAAARVTEEILSDALNGIKPGWTEAFLKSSIERLMERSGAQPSFPSIVASGASSSVPHHSPGRKKIGKGVLLVDIGVVLDNYCSDITRTFCMGRAGEVLRNAYSIVKKAQEESLSTLKDGALSSGVFNCANDILVKELGQPLVHSLGHGLGVEVHDFPEGLSGKSKYRVRRGMAFAIEPAYYKNGEFGVRIEDDAIVTKSGCRLLSRSPEEIIEL